jgi:pantothenate kinase
MMGSWEEFLERERIVYLIKEINSLLSLNERVFVSIAGIPACGKSTLATKLCKALGSQSVIIPMDGFHLTRAELGIQNTFNTQMFYQIQSTQGNGAVRRSHFPLCVFNHSLKT